MTNDKRACVAFICGIKVNASLHKNMLLDVSTYKYSIYLINEWNSNHIQIFDVERNAYVLWKDNLIFDYADENYFSLELSGNNFQGFDYKSCSYFSGMVEGRKIQIYDYEDSTYYLYELV